MTSAVRELAQEDPDAVRKFADLRDDELSERLLEIVEEEEEEVG